MLKEKINSSLKTLPHDFYGGALSAIVSLPVILAYGTASGIGAGAAIFGAIILSLLTGLFGISSPMISGPTAALSVVVASALISEVGSIEKIFVITVLAGVFQLVLGLTKAGEVIKFVPYPVISGFLSGVGTIIIFLQLNPFFGEEVAASPLAVLLNMADTIKNVNPEALTLGLLSLSAMLILPNTRIKNFIPPAIAALIIGSLAATFFGYDVPKIGVISSSLPAFRHIAVLPEELIHLIPIALTFAVVGSVNSLLTGLMTDSLTKTRHNSNKLLFSHGIGNILTGFFGGLMGAGASVRTALNVKSGSRTKFSAFVYAIVLFIIVFFASDLMASIPLSVLAGILFKVGWDIIDVKFLKVLMHAPRHDIFVMLSVFLLTVFYDLIFAVGVGITLAALLFARQIAKETSINIQEVNDKDIMKIERETQNMTNYKIRIIHINGNFFFGSATEVISSVDDLLGTKYLILNYDSKSKLDMSAIVALEDIIERLKARKIKIMLVIQSEEIEKQLYDFKIAQNVGQKHVFFDEFEAIEKAKAYLKKTAQKAKRPRGKKLSNRS